MERLLLSKLSSVIKEQLNYRKLLPYRHPLNEWPPITQYLDQLRALQKISLVTTAILSKRRET